MVTLAAGFVQPGNSLNFLRLGFTLPFAVASWIVVEKGALALKDRLGASPRPVEPTARRGATTRVAGVWTQ